MGKVTVELHSIEGTQAALGIAGQHTVVVDRPEGNAGGRGIGFNGAQMLGLTIGGCFCNDLRYVAEEMGVQIQSIAVSVELELEGTPILTKAAKLEVQCTLEDGSNPKELITRAKASCMASNSLSKGIPVEILQN